MRACILLVYALGQNPTTPGDNLVLDGIPKIPAAIAQETAKYTDFRTAHFQAWRPDKREMLIGTRAKDTNQIFLVKEPLATPEQLTDFPDSAGDASFQPKIGSFFVFQK